jgi:hypothetical protein
MIRLLRKLSFALVLGILASLAFCTAETKLVTKDPAVQPAVARAQLDAQPLVEALDAYHGAHGYYPSSLADLTPARAPAATYTYETNGLFRVYKSMACTAKAKSYEGWHPQSMTDYRKQQDALRAECVSGYSAFELKSPRIATAWSINRGTLVFARFRSQAASWDVGWCSYGDHGTHNGDCGDGTE